MRSWVISMPFDEETTDEVELTSTDLVDGRVHGRRPGTPNGHLSSIELRIAMMRSAGMSCDAIARFLGMSSANILYHANKPRVQQYMLAMQSTFVEDMRPAALRMNEKLDELAMKAVKVAEDTMDDMDRRRSEPGLKQETQLKAAALAVMTAQDILDRAYGKAPKRVEVEQHTTHTIDPEAAGAIADALRESHTVDVTPYNAVRSLGSSGEGDT